MARVLISEPAADTRELMSCLVRRLGHEVVEAPGASGVDVILYEPGSPARPPRDPREELPGASLVVSSIYPPSPPVRAMTPAAYLLKPFSLRQLARALEAALPLPRTA
ncbi:MAG TPA: hypothetical protein VGN69_05525 [Solirubrobacteraceae bacterium]|jgi:hypothetical protein|nr:hypothetical protein [Solirubrobacteraceae bacterium]